MKMKCMKKRLGTAVLAGTMAAAMAIPVFAANGVQAETKMFGSGSTPAGESGNIDVLYDTTGGKVVVDHDENGGDISINNGEYVVIIPTNISFTGMNVGRVSQEVKYPVTVKGAIPSDKTVNVTATADDLKNGNDTIQTSVAQERTTWTAAEAYGTLGDDNMISGKTSTDVLTLSGEAKSPGEYKGVITYKASLS